MAFMTHSICSFPHEVLINIFNHLSVNDRQCCANRVCKLFNQIIADRAFDADRETELVRQGFPQKLIEAIGGWQVWNQLPILDANPENRDFFYNTIIFYQSYKRPIRSNKSHFLFFEALCCRPGERYSDYILLFKENATMTWKLKAASNNLCTYPLQDADYEQIANIFVRKTKSLWNFYIKDLYVVCTKIN